MARDDVRTVSGLIWRIAVAISNVVVPLSSEMAIPGRTSPAAAKAIAILAADKLSHSPEVAAVSEQLCSGCGICATVCPYDAIKIERSGIAVVNDILCFGCGVCAASCPAGAIEVKNERHMQIEEMIGVALGSEK